MIGDLANIVFRLRAALPKRWFAENSPNLQSILVSIATPWAWLYNLISYVVLQTRLVTSTDEWLDLIAFDFFGMALTRHLDETDLGFRRRIQLALLREAATRSAVSEGLTQLVGIKPVIFEPANCGDAGCYGSLSPTQTSSRSGLAYGQAGGWGSLQYPYQFFITVARPATPGVGMLAGYGNPCGGYGIGMISYVDLLLLPGQVTDEDIETTLCSLLPLNAVAWLRLI